tara:strand:+ start:68 stop:232 length:165 start_codon:yes stop_codon:yes gene_type:complete
LYFDIKRCNPPGLMSHASFDTVIDSNPQTKYLYSKISKYPIDFGIISQEDVEYN